MILALRVLMLAWESFASVHTFDTASDLLMKILFCQHGRNTSR